MNPTTKQVLEYCHILMSTGISVYISVMYVLWDTYIIMDQLHINKNNKVNIQQKEIIILQLFVLLVLINYNHLNHQTFLQYFSHCHLYSNVSVTIQCTRYLRTYFQMISVYTLLYVQYLFHCLIPARSQNQQNFSSYKDCQPEHTSS